MSTELNQQDIVGLIVRHLTQEVAIQAAVATLNGHKTLQREARARLMQQNGIDLNDPRIIEILSDPDSAYELPLYFETPGVQISVTITGKRTVLEMMNFLKVPLSAEDPLHSGDSTNSDTDSDDSVRPYGSPD